LEPEEEESAGNGTVEIGYSMNGKDLGMAFAVSNADGAFRFYPAISLNLNEVVDDNIGPDFVKPSQPIAKFDSFDLNKCCSVDELKVLGPERLKDIMLSMGVKCG